MELNIEIGVCRCCLTNGAGFKRLSREYDWMGEKEVYADMLRECFDLVLLQPEEAASMLICEICITRLRDSSNFKKQVVYSEKMFVQRLNTEGKKPSVQLKLERFKHEAEEGDGEGPSDRFESHFFEDDDDNDSSDDTKIVQVKPEPSTSTDALESGDDDEPLSSLSTGLKRKSATESAPAAPSKIRKIAPKAPNTVVGKRLTNIQLKVMPRATSKATVQQKAGVKVAVPVKAGVKGPAKIAVPLKTGTGVKVVTKLGVPLRLNVPQKAGQKMPPLKAGQKMPPQKTGQKMPPLKIQAQKPGQKMPLRLGPINRPLKITMKSSSTVAAQKGALRALRAEMLKEKLNGLGKTSFAAAVLKYSNVTPFKARVGNGFRCFFKCKEDFTPESLRIHTEKEHQIHKTKIALGHVDNIIKIDIDNLKCNICENLMSSLDTFEEHLTSFHNKRIYKDFTDVVIPFKLSLRAYTCQICDKKFPEFQKINQHMHSHYRHHICEICGDGFITKTRLHSHKQCHNPGSYPCEICNKDFSSPTKRKNHTDTVHNSVKKLKCPQCPERFLDYYKKVKHLVNVHNATAQQYACDECDKLFSYKSTLRAHTKKDHLCERNHSCVMCEQKFFHAGELRNHMVKHTGERNFQCEVCKKSYARRKTLMEHMKIHNNVKRFVCGTCGQGFVQNCSLKAHVKTHHPENKSS